MKEKGFTLIELVAVLFIMGLLGIMIVKNVNKLLNEQKTSLHNQQYIKIEDAAESWAVKNLNKIANDGTVTYVNLSTLIDDEFLEQSTVIDPANKQVLNGCVAIKYEIEYHNYDITFINIDDKNYHNECNQAI